MALSQNMAGLQYSAWPQPKSADWVSALGAHFNGKREGRHFLSVPWCQRPRRPTPRDDFSIRMSRQGEWPRQARRAAVLAAALAATALRAKAQDDDIAAGHAFAREARRACHIVEAEESSPREFEIGPAFCDIANVPGMTAAALRVFLTSSRPKMPTLALTPEETRM